MNPIKVEFPLRGDWLAVTTPGDRVPSHGVHDWGMTYAYDFIRVKNSADGEICWHKKSEKAYYLAQVTLRDTFGWGEPIYAPISGVIVAMESQVPERSRLHIITDWGLALINSLFFSFKRGDVKTLCGNYVIIQGDDLCALIAHAKQGSITKNIGDTVSVGEKIAEVGHSGNSTAPHLHFQLMDIPNIKKSKGLPCCFNELEIFKNNNWQSVSGYIPSSQYRLRYID